jgi:hypothetical protein
MDKFIKVLEEKGIKENIMKVLEKNPDADIAEIIEYEISKDEDLEDAFLSEAQELAIHTVCSGIFNEFLTKKVFFDPEKLSEIADEFGNAIGQASEKIIEAFSQAFSGLFED